MGTATLLGVTPAMRLARSIQLIGSSPALTAKVCAAPDRTPAFLATVLPGPFSSLWLRPRTREKLKLALLTPFSKNSAGWVHSLCINTHDGKSYRLDELSRADTVTLGDILCGYIRHPEIKSLGPSGETMQGTCADCCAGCGPSSQNDPAILKGKKVKSSSLAKVVMGCVEN